MPSKFKAINVSYSVYKTYNPQLINPQPITRNSIFVHCSMLKIGLTGGIGSGKTTVAQIFEVLGLPVYYADDAAKRLMNEDENLKQQIIDHFGEESYLDGKLNRSYLSSVVFADAEKMKLINTIIHPATIADAELWMNKQTAPYSIKEAALIFEAAAEKQLDLVIGVQSPLHVRIQRVMQRDHIKEEAVLARMQKQMNEEEKMSRCDFVIVNDEKELLIPQVVAIHDRLLANMERVHN
jgi:dephospho-CoA kinase